MTTVTEEFQFGGRLSLDLTWTLRYRATAAMELLHSPDELRRWITTAIAPVRGPLTTGDLDAAVRLREAVYAAAVATIDGRPVRESDRAVLNDCAARPAAWRRLQRTGRSVLELRPDDQVGSALATVAADAIAVLAAADGRLRLCEGPGCSLVFYDSSRPGRRRWCSTERCGNRVNATTYRRRRAGGTTRDEETPC